MKEITTVGIDLAKSALTVPGVDRMGHTVLRKTVRRENLMELIATLPTCLIGMEECGGAPVGTNRELPISRHAPRLTSPIVQSGASQRALLEGSGWKSEQMVRRYAHLSAEHLLPTARLLDAPPAQLQHNEAAEAVVPTRFQHTQRKIAYRIHGKPLTCW